MIRFLALSDILGWFADIPSNFIGILKNGLRLLFSFISVKIYEVMIALYNVFDILCFTRLLDNDALNALSQRIGLILGLLMLFYVVFSFIKMLIDPDQITDKTKGAVGIIKRVLIVVVMLGVSSFVFNTLFTLQTAIVKNHVITKIILPYELNDEQEKEYNEKVGNIFAAELFYAFYHVDDAFMEKNGEALNDDWKNNSDVSTCLAITYTLKDDIYSFGDFYLVDSCLYETTPIANSYTSEDLPRYIIYFNWFFMIGIGILVDYFLISYCIAVGVRMIRLLVLEVISPMAFVSYLLPKQDGFFSKWLKTYFSTYLDVFIRIGIINFVLFLCMTVLGQDGSWEFWKHIGDQPGSLKLVLTAFMVVALMSFAKKAPDLLKELGFSGGNFGGFSFKKDTGLNISGFGAVTGAVGGAFGAVAGNGSLTFGLLRGARKGLTGGKAMGVSAGFGSAKSGALRDAQRIAAGGSMIVFPGAQAKADRLDAEKEEIEAQSAAAKVISDNVSTVKEYALSQINDGKFVSANTAKRETAMLRISSLQEQASKIKNSDYKTKAIASLKRSDYASTKDYLDAVRAKQVSLADADRARITSQLEVARKDKNDAEKAALDDFVKTKRGSNAVLDSALGNITDAMEHDTTGIGTRLVAKNADGIKGGTGDWLQLDALDGNAKDIQNKNTIRIAENTRDGKRARANAKYSGNGK